MISLNPDRKDLSMKMHQDVTLARIQDAVHRGHTTLDNPGFCIHCGFEADGVEPDARKYECESCGEAGVYGADELLLQFI
jgi:hypothetical protein